MNKNKQKKLKPLYGAQFSDLKPCTMTRVSAIVKPCSVTQFHDKYVVKPCHILKKKIKKMSVQIFGGTDLGNRFSHCKVLRIPKNYMKTTDCKERYKNVVAKNFVKSFIAKNFMKA